MKILLISISIFFISCGHYQDFKYKKHLISDFYLAESEALPNKFICISDEEHYLVILKNVLSLQGNKEIVFVETGKKNNIFERKFYKINFETVDYPEDVIEINLLEFERISGDINIKYYYDEEKGFVRM